MKPILSLLLTLSVISIVSLAVGQEMVATAQSEPMVELKGDVSPEVGILGPAQTAPPEKAPQMEIIFLYPPAMDKFLADQKDPASPDYHHALSAQERVDRFGPSESEFNAVVTWLVQEGFTITWGGRLERAVKFSGTVSQAEQAFKVAILTSSNGELYSNLDNPKIPARFSHLFGHIVGLDNIGAVVPGSHSESSPQLKLPTSLPSHSSSLLHSHNRLAGFPKYICKALVPKWWIALRCRRLPNLL